ncbi:DUF4198 domain-containing protein [uncultured Tateyamaria sp.]|uniref:DUF4198 domain-containing protein n=1 Tax=Tateyamaria sp. 1078 TaxID=3417464 RepID=UPI00263141F8|nr:DUF4198 domain-containing protein [uncultured Tateyamaria sp.]
MFLIRLFLTGWCAIFASIATAHEFWIEAERYQVPAGQNIVARFKNGETFEGVSLSYFDRSTQRFELVTDGVAAPVTPRLGDNPALDVPAPGDGLAVVLHETTPSFVTYKRWAKFQKFADHKDFAGWRAQHDALGFPPPPFKERYTRHAKALIAVGDDGAGADARYGLLTEFVALTNPYVPGFNNVMRVQVHYGDATRPDAQVEVFDRAPDDSVTVTLYRTDADGIAAVPVTPGHDYLFDAVVLEPIAGDETAVWDTHWAALTFSVPAQ